VICLLHLFLTELIALLLHAACRPEFHLFLFDKIVCITLTAGQCHSKMPAGLGVSLTVDSLVHLCVFFWCNHAMWLRLPVQNHVL